MSQAHRPTWNPTQGRETKAGSQQVSKRSLAAHTKLKFRQPGQTTTSDVARRDLRAELAAAERVAEDKKRKAAGLPPLPPIAGALRIEEGVKEEEGGSEDEEARKRRKVLEEAAELDRDDSDSEGEAPAKGKDKGKGKALENGNGNGQAANGNDDDDEEEDEDDDDSDDGSDEEDETAALMAELAKIKAERAEEKARLDAEQNAQQAATREEEIATGNPLLNLQAALGQTPSSASTASTTFAVKRRWDDDRIFKNQAAGLDDKPKKGEFVNDLLRSEFHKKFMQKFIK